PIRADPFAAAWHTSRSAKSRPGKKSMAKLKKTAEPKIIRPDDIDPHHDWKRPLQAPGHTQVDFEERVNFRRLHDYRLARVRAAAKEIKAILDAEGVGDMPLGLDVVEPPMLFELQKLGIEVRDGQQVMLQAREVKNIDELTLLNMASAMVDGVYQDIAEALKPGVKESEIVALATSRLYEMGSACVEATNSISGERCSPHPH